MNVARLIVLGSAPENHLDLPGPGLLPTRLMRATAQTPPVAAAGISAFTKYRHRVPLGASSDTAALAERLQFTVGEGPCLAAHAQMEPLLAPESAMAQQWPAFHEMIVARTPYRSIVSVPINDQHLGGEAAMDLYYEHPRQRIDERQWQHISEATEVVTALLVAGSGLQDPAVPGPIWLNNQAVGDRARVWTAIGMLDVALELNALDALARLRGYAYSHGSTIDEIARSLTTRELTVEEFAL